MIQNFLYFQTKTLSYELLSALVFTFPHCFGFIEPTVFYTHYENYGCNKEIVKKLWFLEKMIYSFLLLFWWIIMVKKRVFFNDGKWPYFCNSIFMFRPSLCEFFNNSTNKQSSFIVYTTTFHKSQRKLTITKSFNNS